MSAQYIIGIVVGLLGIATVAGTWIWKLSSKLKDLENKSKPVVIPIDESKSVADALDRVSFNCREDIKKTLDELDSKVDKIREMVKEITKWQIPGMEEKSMKVMEEMAKAIEKLIVTLDKMKT